MNIESLRHKLKRLQEGESLIKRERKNVEKQICQLLSDQLADEGTHHLAGLKIVTGYNRKWDQEKLLDLLSRGFPEDMFPFASEYKEVRASSKFIAHKHPELWAQLEQALTLTPRKPHITVEEDD